ncbi:hypothetical protein GGX14DRAFT_439180 [Mycena pura]|uniref:DUF1746 domain-containing protein n=1 Tax=Mycena pura TaxID=153505 RepID=A0AAD6VN75_9AGAR|nr:hypothetical protein GGX14DRAFT_439180 [Mycena pura]
MNKRLYAQRKHVIQSLDILLYQLHVLAFFNSNVVGDAHPLTTLIFRVLSQSQCSKPARESDPAWSLRVLFALLVFLNAIVVWNHATASASDKTVILDLIGIAYIPSTLRLVSLDIFILFLQLLLASISYETSLAADYEADAGSLEISPSASVSGSPKSYPPQASAPPYVMDLRFMTVVARLRGPAPRSASNSRSMDGLPLPNTTPWPLPAVGLRMLLGVPPGRTGRNLDTSAMPEAPDTDRIPGALDA